MFSVDQTLAAWFHARLDDTTGPWLQFLSFLGGEILMFVTLVSGVLWLLAKRRWHALITLIVTIPCGILLGEAIKLIVQRQRPYLVGPFVDWAGYSFPSGHAISATLFYGSLCVLAFRLISSRRWRAMLLAAAFAITALVGFSRIALGAHYLTDVLAGFTFGVIWLGLCMFGSDALRKRFCTCAPREPHLGPGDAAGTGGGNIAAAHPAGSLSVS